MNFYLLDLLYFYLCTRITGPPLIPVLITLRGLSSINITIIIIIIIIIIYIVLLDTEECLNRSHACDATANCTNTDGSHNCTCKEGFTGDGQSCKGILG